MDTTPITKFVGNRKGIVLVYVAFAFIVMLGFIGLAVDGGHLLLVRGELQNAADAAALAGAGALHHDPLNPAPDWAAARAKAAEFIKKNKSDGVSLADGTIEVGYWPPPVPDAPLSTVSTDPGQAPAVSVTISRSEGNNGGPVRTFFARMMQKDGSLNALPVSSKAAVAKSGCISSAPEGTAFPSVISKDLITFGDPVPVTPPGQWTSFTIKADSSRILDKYINYLIDPGGINAVPSPALNIGDTLYIVQKYSNGYLLAQKVIDSGKRDIVVPVADLSATPTVITGFITIRLDAVTSESITGSFVKPTAVLVQ